MERPRITASGVLLTFGVLGAASILLLWWLSGLNGGQDFDVGRKVFGNIPSALKAVFYVSMAGFTFVMFWLFAQRAQSWQQGSAERRTGHWGERTKELVGGLLMRTVGEDPVAGAMHSMIYFGFLVLFAGTVTLEIDNLLPTDWKFLEGGFYQGYSAVLDFFGIVFLVGLTWAAVRRYGARPWRIRTKTKPEDGLILVTLAAIGLTGFLVEAARISLLGRPSFEVWSFVGYPLSYLFPEGDASGWHQFWWIIHVVAFAAFLIVTPITKLRHMFTSPANMFLSAKDRPTGAMKDVPNLMEAEDIEVIGASTVGEFTWKQLLDTDACTICGRCTSVCPANTTGKPLDPREIVLKLGEVASATAAVSPPVSVDGEITVSSDLVFERVKPEELWACTTCRACDDICPVDIEILDKILDMRRFLALMEADFPSELGNAYISLENSSNPWGLSQQNRADWRDKVDFPVPILGVDVEEAEYLYWVGCAGSFDDRNLNVTLSTAKLLHEAGIDFAILGPQELCTGDPARRSGNEFVFQQLALQNIATLDELGVKKVVTQCPHCFNTLGNEYPQLGGDYEVVHHSQLLMELVAEGRIATKNGKGASEKTIAYHDACYLGRHNDVFVPPRELVKEAGTLVELGRNGTKSFCCGAGGARFWMEEQTGKKVNIERSEEAVASGADEIATACPFCYVMMDDGVKELGKDDEVAVKDIAMLLAERLPD
jgi:Fe-S oxidoreductase/nitrate reductase gamma subunit